METVVSSQAEEGEFGSPNRLPHLFTALLAIFANVGMIGQMAFAGKLNDIGPFGLTNLYYSIIATILLSGLYGLVLFSQPVILRNAPKLIIWIAFVIGGLQASMIAIASRNLLGIYFSLTFLPLFIWYWLHNGEILSLFGNNIFVFTVRRHIAIIPMFIAISWFTFFLLNQLVDPVDLLLGIRQVRFGKDQLEAAIRIQYGLVDPETGREYTFWERYVRYLNGFIHGDLGLTYSEGVPVTENIGNLLWTTLSMQIPALVISFFLSVTIGILAAYFHQTPLDSAVSSLALLGLSMPIFVSGILAIIIFSGTGLDWFPFGGARSLDHQLSAKCDPCGNTPNTLWELLWKDGNFTNIGLWSDFIQVSWVYTADLIWHLVLPVLTLTFATMATFSRLTRGSMLEVLREDYILAARANGLSERNIVVRHALPNVMLPITTFLGLSIGGILAGAPITETVFNWPGLGVEYVAAVGILDGPVIVGLTMIITLMILLANMLTDIAYTRLDPRITL